MAKFLDKTGLNTLWAKIKSLVTSSIQALDVSSVGGAGKYISAISETDGKISATATTMDTTPTASSTNAVTSGGVKTALDGKASSSHTHTVKINGADKTIAATSGPAVDLGTYTEFAHVSDTAVIGNNSPAADCKTYFVNNVANGSCKVVYCKNGEEYTIIFSKQSSGTYGNIIKYGYSNKFIYILRYKNGTWQSDDWEKIEAGYADSAASATKATQDSDGNAINATYFKSSGNVTLVSNTATKIGTQNGTDVKLTLPTIPSGTQLVYDCGTGSTSGTDFDNALAAFNAGRWVIIHQYTNVYYCVGTYNSGLRFKRLTNDTTILKVDTLNWTRGGAPAAGTALEAALVGHTHSNYVPTSRKINGKTLDEDITLTSSDVAAASVGPSNSSKDWIELGTFQYNDSNVMFAGLTLAVQFRANDGRNESGILWISTGEYKASGDYSNADVVAAFSTISRRSATKTERFALYFNSLGTTSTSGVKLYAKVQSYSSVYVTPVNAVKDSWVPSMTYLDSEPATKVEVSYYALLKSTPGSGIGDPSTPVYVNAQGLVIPCSGETATAASKTDWSATARIARRQTYVYAPVGWSIGTSSDSGYDSARHITLAESGNFPGLDLRATVFRNNSGNLDVSLRGRTDQIANSWLSGARVYHCGKVVVRSANTTETVTRIYSGYDFVGAGGVLKFAFCDPSFPSSSYTQFGTWEGSMIIDPDIVGVLSIRISFNMVFRIEATDNNTVMMGGRFHIESDGDVQFVYV